MTKRDSCKVIEYWLKGAKEEMRIASKLFRLREYPYALFRGHLALEKALKAKVVKNTDQHPPFTHDLLLLATKAKPKLTPKEKKFLDDVSDFNWETRYPEEIEKMKKKYSSPGFANKYFQKVKKFYQWLKSENKLSK